MKVGIGARSRSLRQIVLVFAVVGGVAAPQLARATPPTPSLIPAAALIKPLQPHAAVNFTAVAVPGVTLPAGVTVAANEECRHLSFKRTTYNQGGGKLYDFYFYLAWCANKTSHVITKVLDHYCRTTPYQTWLGYDSPCQLVQNGTPGGGRTSLDLYDEWNLWAAGASCCWNYRPLVDATFTGDWKLSGYYYYW